MIRRSHKKVRRACTQGITKNNKKKQQMPVTEHRSNLTSICHLWRSMRTLQGTSICHLWRSMRTLQGNWVCTVYHCLGMFMLHDGNGDIMQKDKDHHSIHHIGHDIWSGVFTLVYIHGQLYLDCTLLVWEFIDGCIHYFNQGSFKSKIIRKRMLNTLWFTDLGLCILFVLYGLGEPFGLANSETVQSRVCTL